MVTLPMPCAAQLNAAPRADRPATDHQCIGLAGMMIKRCAAKPDRVPATGDRFGQRRPLKRHLIGHGNEIRLRHAQPFRKGALTRWHGNDLAVRAQIVAAGLAGPADAAGHQRIDRDPPAVIGPAMDDAGGFVAEDQRCRPAFIMPQIGMHVRTAYADAVNPDQPFTGIRRRLGNLAEVEALRCRIDEGLHFAVNPPSTISTWPVT